MDLELHGNEPAPALKREKREVEEEKQRGRIRVGWGSAHVCDGAGAEQLQSFPGFSKSFQQIVLKIMSLNIFIQAAYILHGCNNAFYGVYKKSR